MNAQIFLRLDSLFYHHSLLFPMPHISAPGLLVFFPTVPVVGSAPGAESSLMIRELAFFNVSSASRSMRLIKSLQVGISIYRGLSVEPIQDIR